MRLRNHIMVLVLLGLALGTENARAEIMTVRLTDEVTHASDGPSTYHVDAAKGDDRNSGLSPERALATIQRAIDGADDGSTILVHPGVYTEALDFKGKAIIITSAADAAILQAPNDVAVSFCSGEWPDSVLKNFVIRNSRTAVLTVGSSPTVRNLTVADNEYGLAAVWALPDVSNCIFWNNTGGDLFGCEVRHSFSQDDLKAGLTEGLVSHWRFDEGDGTIAHDSVGENHGTVQGAKWTTGRVGGALSFDGDGDFVFVGDDDTLEPQQLTLSLWAQLYPSKMVQGGIAKGRLCSVSGFSYKLSFDGLWAYACMSPRPADSFCALTFVERTGWHMWSMTVGEGRICIYRDGVLENSREYEGPICYKQTHNNFVIGASEDGTCSLTGNLDDVRLYRLALSPVQIRQLYQLGLTGSVSFPEPLFADPDTGDYHLRSERGRYWPKHEVWVLDDVTSPCIDAGDPGSDYSAEPQPNGGRINMGAFGGTAFAGMSRPWAKSDIHPDGLVNMLDLAALACDWLKSEVFPPNQVPRVRITSPPDETGMADCTFVEMEAEASDADGVVTKVEFYVDGSAVGQKIGKIAEDTDGSDGWKTTWLVWTPSSSYPSGKYTLTARATDDKGAVAVSSKVDIVIAVGGYPGASPGP
jgi:hypothetical protein